MADMSGAMAAGSGVAVVRERRKSAITAGRYSIGGTRRRSSVAGAVGNNDELLAREAAAAAGLTKLSPVRGGSPDKLHQTMSDMRDATKRRASINSLGGPAKAHRTSGTLNTEDKAVQAARKRALADEAQQQETEDMLKNKEGRKLGLEADLCAIDFLTKLACVNNDASLQIEFTLYINQPDNVLISVEHSAVAVTALVNQTCMWAHGLANIIVNVRPRLFISLSRFLGYG